MSDWRSGYLFCPDCLNVYYANQIVPAYSDDGKYMRMACPNAMCENYYGLAGIDELMIEPIVKLNRKGYKTDYCCSGHFKSFIGYGQKLEFTDTAGAYISFVIAIDSCPEGWEIDKNFIGKSRVIRSKCKTMAESYENLMKWVEELPDILKKEED